MGQSYEQVILRKRVEIEILRHSGVSMRQVGRVLGRSASTISRELARLMRGRPGHGQVPIRGSGRMIWRCGGGAGMRGSSWHASRTCAVWSGTALRWDDHPNRSPAG
jgi:hypothetical protein